MASTAERLLYLDASALVKLVVDEPETRPLVEAVTGARLVSSEIALAEVPRALRRIGDVSFEPLLRSLAYIPLGRRVLVAAGAFDAPSLRTLDAIHVASALEIAADLELFITYDANQARAARVAGLPLSAPR